jgi:hypothetical protein
MRSVSDIVRDLLRDTPTSEGSVVEPGPEPSLLDGQLVEERVAFENCRRTVQKWWPAYWPYAEAVLSVAATLKLSGVPAAIALFAMGDSGVGKNTVFKMVDWDLLQRLVLWRDKFTVAAIQSAYQGETADKLSDRALFKKAKHKLLVTPEMALMFRGRSDELEKRFSELAQLLDGEGRISDSGTHGALGEKGDFTFVWVGGTTPFYLTTWNTMAALGTRLLFFRILKGPYVDDEQYVKALHECKATVSSFLDVFLPEASIRSIANEKWPTLSPELKARLQHYAALMALGHSSKQHLSYGAEVGVTRPSPNHFRSRLGYIVRGRALVHGRSVVNEDDLQMARWITMSSMPQNRGFVLMHVYEGDLEIGDIAEKSGLSYTVVRNTLEELKRLEVIGLGARQRDGNRGKPAHQHSLCVEEFEEQL